MIALLAAYVYRLVVVGRARLQLLRVRIGTALYNVGEKLTDWGLGVSGANEEIKSTPEEEALRERRAQDSVARILARVRTPCPTCAGQQYIRVPDGWEPCPACDATGIRR